MKGSVHSKPEKSGFSSQVDESKEQILQGYPDVFEGSGHCPGPCIIYS